MARTLFYLAEMNAKTFLWWPKSPKVFGCYWRNVRWLRNWNPCLCM